LAFESYNGVATFNGNPFLLLWSRGLFMLSLMAKLHTTAFYLRNWRIVVAADSTFSLCQHLALLLYIALESYLFYTKNDI